MRIGDIYQIEERENDNFFGKSSWTTYLCLEILEEDKFRLCVKVYEILGKRERLN